MNKIDQIKQTDFYKRVIEPEENAKKEKMELRKCVANLKERDRSLVRVLAKVFDKKIKENTEHFESFVLALNDTQNKKLLSLSEKWQKDISKPLTEIERKVGVARMNRKSEARLSEDIKDLVKENIKIIMNRNDDSDLEKLIDLEEILN